MNNAKKDLLWPKTWVFFVSNFSLKTYIVGMQKKDLGFTFTHSICFWGERRKDQDTLLSSAMNPSS